MVASRVASGRRGPCASAMPVRAIVDDLVGGERRVAAGERDAAARGERVRSAGRRRATRRRPPPPARPCGSTGRDDRAAGRAGVPASTERRRVAAAQLDRDLAERRRARHRVGDRLADEDDDGRPVALGEEPHRAHEGVVRPRSPRRAATAKPRRKSVDLAGERLARCSPGPGRAGGRLRARACDPRSSTSGARARP